MTKLKTSMFYAYHDSYGWTIGRTWNAGLDALFAVERGPRTFATRADAEVFIQSICQ